MDSSVCVCVSGIRDGLLLQTGVVWPQIGIQLFWSWMDWSVCIRVPGIRDGLLLQTGVVWPQTEIHLSRPGRVLSVVAVSGPRLEARHFLLKRKEVPPASHYCSKQVFTLAFWRISHVFHEVRTLWYVVVRYCYINEVKEATVGWIHSCSWQVQQIQNIVWKIIILKSQKKMWRWH